MSSAFWFWLMRPFAELTFVLGFWILIATLVIVGGWVLDRVADRKRRRRQRDPVSQGGTR